MRHSRSITTMNQSKIEENTNKMKNKLKKNNSLHTQSQKEILVRNKHNELVKVEIGEDLEEENIDVDEQIKKNKENKEKKKVVQPLIENPFPQLDLSPLKRNKIKPNKSAEKVKGMIEKDKQNKAFRNKLKTQVSKNPIHEFDKNIF